MSRSSGKSADATDVPWQLSARSRHPTADWLNETEVQ